MAYSISSFNETTGKLQLPFPSLDNFSGCMIPVFNVTEELVVDHDTFITKVSFINEVHSRIYNWSLYLSMITLVCLLFAGCFQLVYWANTPVVKQTNERLRTLEHHERQNKEVDETVFIYRKFFFTL